MFPFFILIFSFPITPSCFPFCILIMCTLMFSTSNPQPPSPSSPYALPSVPCLPPTSSPPPLCVSPPLIPPPLPFSPPHAHVPLLHPYHAYPHPSASLLQVLLPHPPFPYSSYPPMFPFSVPLTPIFSFPSPPCPFPCFIFPDTQPSPPCSLSPSPPPPHSLPHFPSPSPPPPPPCSPSSSPLYPHPPPCSPFIVIFSPKFN